MAVRYELADLAQKPDFFADTVCTLGVFDGMHLGHQSLIQAVIQDAQQRQARSCVITFDRDPDEIFAATNFKKLSSNAERLSALDASGLDYVVVIPFTHKLAQLSPQAFLQQVFGSSQPISLHVGKYLRFGHQASGGLPELSAWAQLHQVRIVPHAYYAQDGLSLSATRIRTQLSEGKVREAAQLLGRAFSLEGFVVSGRGEGAHLGFRTANIHPPQSRALPCDGVYAVQVQLGEARYWGAASVGSSPMYPSEHPIIEVHILDFAEDIYGAALRMYFIEHIRSMEHFASSAELSEAIAADIAQVRALSRASAS